MPPANKSIFDYFKKAPPAQKENVPLQAEASRQTDSGGVKAVPLPPTQLSGCSQPRTSVSKTPEPPEHSSSLSSPPVISSARSSSSSADREPTPLPVASSNAASSRVINSTDDEDSDSSLEELESILATKRTDPRQISSVETAPKTPTASRKTDINYEFPSSPLAVLSKSQFDMKALMSYALKDNAAEASSKRVKAMIAPKNEKEHNYLELQDQDVNKVQRSALLESVVGGQPGGIAKVERALVRTEATIPEKRWYFFDTQDKPVKGAVNQFPKGSAIKGWEGELQEPRMRQQSFITGFVEDMVILGKQLPDELFLWVLDEAFLETHEPLRNSYLDVLQECSKQIERFVSPEVVQSLFRKLGATESASTITQTIKPVLKLSNPYPNHKWTRVCSIIRFLGRMGASLKSNSRTHIICMILRMSVDRVIVENVDLLVDVHRAIYYLCRDTPKDEWESNCSDICKTLMAMVLQPTFRLQMVNSIPSGSAVTHDLRRRLAMCFFFNDLSYSMSHPHTTMDLGRFVKRLEDSEFDATPRTDYPELTALVLLLDVAVDDGQSTKLDLADPETEKRFNKDVDLLVASIKEIMTSIGNPGAAFISRIEAKEALELVSQRIADTVRTKKVVKESWFDRNHSKVKVEKEREQKKISSFMLKMDQTEKEVNGIAST